MLKRSSRTDNARKSFVKTTIDSSIDEELKFFKVIQSNFQNSTFLLHFDVKRSLYMNVDAFKRYKFEAILYHVMRDSEIDIILKNDKTIKFSRTKVQLILFLSKVLSTAKRNYWSTELKMTDLVWLVRKTRHLIEADFNVHIALMFTNHTVVTNIARQMKLVFFNTDKLNLRLIRISQYLSQFNLNIRYRSDKIHLVSDVLSRLLDFFLVKKEFVLDDLSDEAAAYNVTLVEMFSNFRKKLLKEYNCESQ